MGPIRFHQPAVEDQLSALLGWCAGP
jgi:hypothetical protein